MPDQFVVPQFLDVEAKIIGPITGRQFGILMVTVLLDFILYRIFLSVVGILLFVVPLTIFALLLAFAKVNGQPLHYLMLNMVRTIRRPRLRVWNNELSTKELRSVLKKEEKEPPPPHPPSKPMLESSRLEELSLIVNTGGLYNPESEHEIEKKLAEYGNQKEK